VDTPQLYGRMLWFARLAQQHEALIGVYTLAWRLTDEKSEPWTHRINEFKARSADAVAGACDILPMALKSMNYDTAPTIVTAAIPSAESSLPADSPLSELGAVVAHTLGSLWMPELLSKKPHQSLHLQQSATSRQAEVEGKYSARALKGAPFVMILDDMVTRGSTMSDAARAIVSTTPATAKVCGLALGRTTTRRYSQEHGYDVNNDHLPQSWIQRWDSWARLNYLK
jgi:hypothetical protein